MGVDPTPRAKYRRGELRLVLGLPEPWTEAQRDDFLKAVEGISAVAGVAAGDVSVQSALLTSWNPSDEQPAGVITSADVEKLIIKFGLDEPRLRKEVADEAYRSGRISCERGHDDVKAAYFKSGYDAGKREVIEELQAISHRLSPKPVAHPVVPVAPVYAFGPHSGKIDRVAFNLGPLTSAELADVAEPALSRPIEEDPTANPHGPGSPEADTGRYRASPNAEACSRADCLIRHTVDTAHVWGVDEIDALGAEGKLCDLETCFDFHYVNDGSPHRFVNPEQTSKPMFAEADEDEDDDYSRADEGWGTED